MLKKILIETSWQLGDCVIGSSLLESIVEKNPNVEIDMIVRKNSLDMFKYYPYIKNIYPDKRFKNKILRYLEMFYFIYKNRNKYDLIISYETGATTIHTLFLKLLNPKKLISRRKNRNLKKVDYYFSTTEEVCDIMKINKNKNYKVYLGEFEEYAKNFFEGNKINVIFNYIGSKEYKTLLLEEVKRILKVFQEYDNMVFFNSK